MAGELGDLREVIDLRESYLKGDLAPDLKPRLAFLEVARICPNLTRWAPQLLNPLTAGRVVALKRAFTLLEGSQDLARLEIRARLQPKSPEGQTLLAYRLLRAWAHHYRRLVNPSPRVRDGTTYPLYREGTLNPLWEPLYLDYCQDSRLLDLLYRRRLRLEPHRLGHFLQLHLALTVVKRMGPTQSGKRKLVTVVKALDPDWLDFAPIWRL